LLLPLPVLLGVFDMLPLEEPLEEPPEVPLLPLVEPLLPELVLLGELEEPDELPPAAEPCDALYSSRLSLPS